MLNNKGKAVRMIDGHPPIPTVHVLKRRRQFVSVSLRDLGRR
jgi:hypothetical protein